MEEHQVIGLIAGVYVLGMMAALLGAFYKTLDWVLKQPFFYDKHTG